MTYIVRRFLVLAVAVSVAGVVSACGGGSPAASGPATVSTAPSTKTASGPDGGDATQFCAVVKQQKALLQGTALAGLLTGGGPDAWKTYLDQTTAMNDQLVAAAPAEIQPDVKTLQDGTLQLKTTLAAADYDVTKVGAAQLIGIMRTPARTAATTSVVAYVKTNCGIDLTTP